MKNHRSILRSFCRIIATLFISTALAACAGPHSYEVVTKLTTKDGSDFKTATPECPPGKVAIGGGARVFGHSNNIALYANGPEGDDPSAPTKWFGGAQETTPTTEGWGLRVDVFCVEKTP